MGMAASQARLLMITGRMHDLEFEAQSIQHAKLQLAEQQDQVYQEYLRALEATSLTFASVDTSGTHSTLIANFNNLFGEYGAHTATGLNYALIDSRGRVVVDEAVYNGYYEFMQEDAGFTHNAQGFALFMLSGGGDFTNHTSHGFSNELMQAIYEEINNSITGEEPSDPQLLNLIEEAGIQPSADGSISMDALVDVFTSNAVGMNELLKYFFNHHGQQVLNNADISDQDSARFNYYVRIFNAIQQHGGCISINDFDGPSGDAASNSEWLTNMIQSGQFSIEQFHIDSNGNISLSGTSVSSDQNLTYTNTTQIDKTALARAEAAYEHALKVIDRKDKRFDLSLKRLETERNALDKQREGLEKVIEDNIDRTFKIFS